MKENTMTSKDIMHSISAMASICSKHLLGKGKKYDILLKAILELDWHDEHRVFPSNKQLYTFLGLTPGKYRKYLLAIYEDLEILLQSSGPVAFDIQEVEYEFFCYGYSDSLTHFRAKLPVAPQIGDAFEIPYVKAKDASWRYMYVDSIEHVLTDRKQIIRLILQTGRLNPYEKHVEGKEEYDRKQEFKRRLKYI